MQEFFRTILYVNINHRYWQNSLQLSNDNHSESSSDEEEAREDFAKQALEAHNAYRKRHGVKSLKLSKKVEIMIFNHF